MAKIVHFPTDQDNVIRALEELLEIAKTGEIKSFVFAAKCESGDIATSHANTDVGTRGELASHIQVDVMYAVVEANVDRLIKLI